MILLPGVCTALIILHLCLCSTSHCLEYCVVPDAALDCGGCPLPLNNTPCHTLQYYANNSYFTSNTVFHFLEGEHALDTAVEVTNVANFSLVGAGPLPDSSKVLCGGPASAGFLVQNFVNLRVEYLYFVSCSGANKSIYILYDEILLIRAALLLCNGSELSIDHVTVSNTSGYGLTALAVQHHSSISNSIFSDNHGDSQVFGSNVLIRLTSSFGNCLEHSEVYIDSCKFLNGYSGDYGYGGVGGGLQLYINCTNIHVTITNSVFNGNRGDLGANLFIGFVVFTGNFVEISNTTSSNGSSISGAGLFIGIDQHLPRFDTFSCGYTSTRQPHYLVEISNMTIAKNTGAGAFCIGDAIDPRVDCTAQHVLMRDSVITENGYKSSKFLGQQGSASVWFLNPIGQFRTIQATFQNVTISASTAEISYLFSSSSCFVMVLNVTFIDCTFENNQMTAILAIGSNLIFQGEHTFRNNSAISGAGITLLQSSYMFLVDHTHITFADNYASDKGAAMYVYSGIQVAEMPCFIQYGYSPMEGIDIKIDVIGNKAGTAGSSLYLPTQNECMKSGTDNIIYNVLFPNSIQKILKEVSHLRNTESEPSTVSSDPIRICICMSGHQMPDCSLTFHSVSTYPGEDFTLRLAVVGIMDGTVPGTIHAKFPQSLPMQAHLGELQDTQQNKHARCNDFTYTLFSNKKSVRFQLLAALSVDTPILNINVDLRDCPIGFALQHDICMCDPVINENNIPCFINSQDWSWWQCCLC